MKNASRTDEFGLRSFGTPGGRDTFSDMPVAYR